MNPSKRRRPGLTVAWVTKLINNQRANKYANLPAGTVLVECSAGPPEPTRDFGPFKNLPCEQIESAGFSCRHCGRPVEVLRHAVGIVPRICIYSCGCRKTVIVWEDEYQPSGAKRWARTVKMLKKARRDVLICNGAKPLTPRFSGLN